MSAAASVDADSRKFAQSGSNVSMEAGISKECDSEAEGSNPALEAWYDLKDPKNATLRALFIMVFLEVSGFALSIPSLAFFAIKELGLRPHELGFILSANAFTQMVGAWGCGRLSDSFGRRWLLIGSYAWSCMNIGGTALVYSYTHLLILRSLGGLSGGTGALCQAFIADWVPERKRPGMMGLFGFVNGIAFICGNGLGVFLIFLELERRHIFLIAAFCAFLATIYGLVTIQESLDAKNRRPLCGSDEGDRLRTRLTRDLEVVGVGLTCVWFTRFLLSLGNAVILTTYAFFIERAFGWADEEYGLMMAMCGLLYALLQLVLYPFFGRRGKAGSAEAVLVANICGVCGGFIFPIPIVLVHLVSALCLTSAAALSEPAVPVLVGLFAGEAHLGFGNGVATAFRCAAAVLGPYLGGVLFEQGVHIMCWVGCSIYFLGILGSVGIYLSPASSEEGLTETSLIQPKS